MFIHCGTPTQKSTSKIKFTKAYTIEFDIKKETEAQSKYLFYYLNGINEFLVNLNKDDNILEFYDFKSKKLFYEINLNKNPETSPKLWGFYVHNLDSIFTLRYRENIIAIIDTAGNVRSKWQITDNIYNSKKYELTAWANCPFYYKDKKIFVNSRIFSYKEFYDVPSWLIIDLSYQPPLLTKTGTFPNIYRQGKDYYAFNSYGVLNENNQLIFSFEIDPNLYVYNKDSFTAILPAKSRYLDDGFEEFDTTQVMDLNYVSKYQIISGKYSQIIYDKFRNLYYRMVHHKQQHENPDGTINEYFDKEWSIIIMDASFNILDEIKMESRKYYFNNILVTQDGLLISNNHELNAHYTPNKFSFSLFKIEHE